LSKIYVGGTTEKNALGNTEGAVQNDNPEKLATRRKTNKKHNTISVGHHYTQQNTNNLNKTCVRPLTNNWR